MTESEWLACSRPTLMLRHLLGTDYPRVRDVEAFPNCKGSARQLRLFACACYDRVRHLLPQPLAQAAVEVAERVAEGRGTREELHQAERLVREPLEAMEGRWRASRGAERAALEPTYDALALALQVVHPEAPKAAYYASSNAYLAVAALANAGGGGSRNQLAEERAQSDILRCIFGAVFHPTTIPSEILTWNNGTVVKLAQGIYDERAFDRLPVLADALEEAGCQDTDILGHCRHPGPHVRGCWVVDLLIGRN